jgi:hypothetical protein
MDRAKLIKNLKKTTRLRIDQVRITTNEGELTGKGRFHCKGDSFWFRVTLDPGQKVARTPARDLRARRFLANVRND